MNEEEESVTLNVKTKENNHSFCCMSIPYDDSFEYSEIMELISLYSKKNPMHQIKDMSVKQHTKNNMFNMLWGSRRSSSKYNLHLSILEEHRDSFEQFIGNTLTIKVNKE